MEDSFESGVSNQVALLLLIPSVVILLVGGTLVHSPSVFQSLSPLEPLGPLLSGLGGLGTLVLAYVYIQQHEVLKTQARLQSIEHEPSVRADRVRGKRMGDGEGSQYEIELSNTGKGVARDLKLRIEPSVDHDELFPVEETHQMTRVRSTTSEWINAQSAYLNPGETQVRFTSHAAMRFNSDPDSSNGGVFEFITEELSKTSVEQMGLCLFVEYIGPDGQDREDKVLDYRIPIKGRTTLQAALQHGLPSDSLNLEARVDTERFHMQRDSASEPLELE